MNQSIPLRSVKAISKLRLAKLGFTAAAGISFVLSNYLWFSGNQAAGLYVGIWVPSILSFGTLVLARNNHE